jgi:hypothetical protein
VTTSVALTDAELALLNGRCSDKVQAEVNGALARIEAAGRYDLPHDLAGLIADVVTEARNEGRIIHRPARLSYCRWCKTSAGYALFKSGPRRGRRNLNRPLTLSGIEMAVRFVRVENHVRLGACSDCMAIVRPSLITALADVQAEVPDALAAEGRPAWKRYDNRHCTVCDWTGHEGQMGKLRTLIGDGWYPGKCPSCGHEDGFGSRKIESRDGFAVVELARK